MKKSLVLIIAFLILFSLNNMNAGTFVDANTKDYTPKNGISDIRKSKKIKTIQQLLSTKIGRKIEKFIIKKTLKKLQKQILNPQNKTNKKDSAIRLVTVMFVLGILSLLGGIGFIIAGSTLLGIILTIIGLLILGTLAFFISLLANAFRH